MKKCMLLTCFILLIAVSVEAQDFARLNNNNLRSISSARSLDAGGGAAGPCDGITGSVTFLYNGDYTSDTDAACSSGKDKLDGTVSGAGVTTSTDYIYIPNVIGDRYVQWTIDSTEINADEGTIWVSIYVTDNDTSTDLDAVVIAEIGNTTWDASNYFAIATASDGTGDGRVQVTRVANGVSDSVATPANSIALTTWYRCGYSWKTPQTGNDHAIMCTACGGGGTQADCSGKGTWVGAVEEDDDLQAFTGTINEARVGIKDFASSQTDGERVADFYILSGFKTADPF